MTEQTDAAEVLSADQPCRCLHQMPHVRGEVGGPFACKHALGDEDAALLRAVRAYCADSKEKRDWPELADKQAHKIAQSVLRSNWLAAREAAARAEAWDEAAQAVAWVLTNGPSDTAAEYLLAQNPYRIARTDGAGS